jgi:hypothetical protein
MHALQIAAIPVIFTPGLIPTSGFPAVERKQSWGCTISRFKMYCPSVLSHIVDARERHTTHHREERVELVFSYLCILLCCPLMSILIGSGTSCARRHIFSTNDTKKLTADYCRFSLTSYTHL